MPALLALAIGFVSCSRPISDDALILTEVPTTAHSEPARDVLDLRYPAGSRVVLAEASLKTTNVRVLSHGLCAACEPVLSYDATRVVFAGKATPASEWQIYEVQLGSGFIRVLTKAKGGAMDPALLGDGSLLYISPVPSTSPKSSKTPRTTLFVQSPGSHARQLSFGSTDIFSPTVLADGRILFVSSKPSGEAESWKGQALYTMNNDGTEVTAFAGQHVETGFILRPRQLDNGRIGFVSCKSPCDPFGKAEFVLSSRPFRSPSLLFPNTSFMASSIEPGQTGESLVCTESAGTCTNGCHRSSVFRISSDNTISGTPSFEDKDWSIVESLPVIPSKKPMGRLSTVDFKHQTGQILCLDANNSTYNDPSSGIKATRIRVFAEREPGCRARLGEVDLQADGSFMAEVPADTPLGFEALDNSGQVLRRVDPFIWVRPGENRSCIGCHEPHNHSPRNARPLAVRVPVPQLLGETDQAAQAAP